MRHTLSLALLAVLCACSSTVYPPAQPSTGPSTTAVLGQQAAPQPPFDATPITPVESAGAAAADERA